MARRTGGKKGDQKTDNKAGGNRTQNSGNSSTTAQKTSIVASGQEGDWSEGSDEARQKQLAALPRRDVGTVVGEPGQDEIQVVKIVAPKMREDAVRTDFENWGQFAVEISERACVWY